MEVFRPKSTSDQLAEHLRREIHDGTLGGTLPGIQRLVKMLGVNSVAVAKALRQLEHEGLVINRGSRKLRLIAPVNVARPGFLKIGMLYYDRANVLRHDAAHLEKELGKAGHIVVTAPKSMMEMGMDAKRTARLVKSMDVDA